MKRTAIFSVIVFLFPVASVAISAEADLTRQVKQLQSRVTELEGRVAKLEAEPAPAMSITLHYARKSAKPRLTPDRPIDDDRQAVIADARARVARLAAEVQRHGRQLSPHLGPDRETLVARWADAYKGLIGLLAEHGQERAAASALTEFHMRKNLTTTAQRKFEQAAYAAAMVFLRRWKNPDAAMRIAAAYGPKSVYLGDSWGALCEQAAAASGGKGEFKALALKCYLRAATIDPRVEGIWEQVRRLETELGPWK